MRLTLLLALLAPAPLFARGADTIKTDCTGIIRVGLAHEVKKTSLEFTGPIKITDLATGKSYESSNSRTIDIKPDESGLLAGPYSLGPQARIAQLDESSRFGFNGKTYKGSILLKCNSNRTLTIIEELGLEEYLYGVLPLEMGPEWPLEALKAQAVTARTYALANMKRFDDSGYDLSADIRSQAYGGAGLDNDKIIKAVKSTEGEVLTYGGELVEAFYHANCGGRTSPPIWGDWTARPLKGVACKYCRHSPYYKWRLHIKNDQILDFLAGIGHPAEKLKGVRVLKRNKAMRVTLFQFVTDEGKVNVKTEDLRKWLGSTDFKSSYIIRIGRTKSGYEFLGRGYGHGVGMCQDGAKTMANLGKSYKRILQYYYPGTKIKKWQPL